MKTPKSNTPVHYFPLVNVESLWTVSTVHSRQEQYTYPADHISSWPRTAFACTRRQ